MAFVGDVILGSRELMTDLPQTIPAPLITNAAPTVGPNNFGPGTIYFVATQLNQFGESLPSAESSLTLASPANIAINVSADVGATFIRIYYAGASGVERDYLQFPASVTGGNLVVINSGILAQQTPPTRSTAYLPDTDGAAIGAFAIYRWLNQALGWAAAKNRGGLPDFGAAATVNGQPNYIMPGYWKKIDSAWFDGYPLGLLNKNNVFRRNPVPGFSGMLVVFQATDRLMVEAWPQPNRTSAQTTLAAPMTATDTVATLTSVASFLLGFGLAQIGGEIVNYAAISGNTLTGLQRGMSGTVPVAHLAAESVTELNLMIAGYRVPSTYSVGQAATTLYLPPGWDEALISYMLYKFRSAEQDDKAAQRYLQEATQKLSDLSANRIIAGPRQVQPFGNVGPETAQGLGTSFGGVIVP